MVTESDKVLTPSNLGLIGASRISRSPSRHQQLFLHSIQEDGSAQVIAQASLASHISCSQARDGTEQRWLREG